MKKIILSLMFISILCIPFIQAQRISADAHLGWAVPQGKAFSYDENSGAKEESVILPTYFTILPGSKKSWQQV